MRVELPDDVNAAIANVAALTTVQKERLYDVLMAYEDYVKHNRFYYYTPDVPMRQFFDNGNDTRIRGLISANRVGKTYSSTFEVVCHATGIYPTKETHGWDWHGVRYKNATKGWVLGYTMESICSPKNIRDLLIGTPDDWGTGWIPKHLIDHMSFVNEGKGLVKEIKVKHTSGDISSIGIRFYSQGMSVLMGASLDYFLIDESPKDDTIFPQMVTRIQKAQDRLGRGMVSATPEFGLQPLIEAFVSPDGPYHKGYTGCTVWDVSHITEQDIVNMKADIPKHQWDMRLKGLPVLGSGAVYPIEQKDIEYDNIPIEDHWKVVIGIDFGWTHPAAVVFVAWDMDTDMIYVYQAKKQAEWSLPEMAAFINSNGTYPVVWPADGGNETQGASGIGMKDQLDSFGCNMNNERFHNPIVDGKKNNAVEAGLANIRTMLKIGKLKIHRNLLDLLNEYRVYHYDPKTGKVSKTNDDLMDAMRYAVQSVRQYGESKLDQNTNITDFQNYVSNDY